MNTLTFQSDFSILDGEMTSFDQNTVKNEPMLFSCDIPSALKLSGPITQDFLTKCPQEFLNSPDAILDTRVHMLMPNWFPAIPGWHLDDVPRTRIDGQPDHQNPTYQADHVFAIIGDEPQCNTEFIKGTVILEDAPLYPKRSIYGIWHNEIESMIAKGMLNTHSVPTRKIIKFNWQSFHRGIPAKSNGWRWFGRLTINTHRKPLNEVRSQVQVYLPWPMEGW